MDQYTNKQKVMFITMRNPFNSIKGEQVVVKNRHAYLEKKYNKKISFFVLRFFFQKREEGVNYIDIGMVDLILGVTNYFFKKIPIQAALYSSSRVSVKVSNIFHMEKFDTIHFFQLRTFLTGSHIESDKVILEFIDALSLNYATRLNEGSWLKKIIIKHELSRLESFERSFNKKILKIFVSSVDRDFLSLSNSIVIPNPIFINQALVGSIKEYDLVFSGNFKYGPNVNSIQYFLEYTFQDLRIKFPDITIYLVGIGSENFINKQAGIYGSGKVENIFKHIAKARISVAPMLSGSGMQNKILESFSVGLPVVSTKIAFDPIVNFAGHNQYFLCAETSEEWIDGVGRLLNLNNQSEVSNKVLEYASMFDIDRCHVDFDRNVS